MTLRIYVDTSVIGGCADDEFAEESRQLLDMARNGNVILLVSDVVVRELTDAPQSVLRHFQSLPESAVEAVPLSEDVLRLRDAYLSAEVVSRKWMDDATHVAAAAVAKADAVVSWNFKHIVRLDKIKAYNEVNDKMGYGVLTILSPKEVVYDDANENQQDV
ncbi:MAG: PIN domain-containing protein [Pirellulales bacterium]|nr:PIN domain-containing protein [Pirellulales bacterium]